MYDGKIIFTLNSGGQIQTAFVFILSRESCVPSSRSACVYFGNQFDPSFGFTSYNPDISVSGETVCP